MACERCATAQGFLLFISVKGNGITYIQQQQQHTYTYTCTYPYRTALVMDPLCCKKACRRGGPDLRLGFTALAGFHARSACKFTWRSSIFSVACEAAPGPEVGTGT